MLQELLQRFAGGVGLDKVFAEIAENGLIAEQFARLIVHHQDVDLISVHAAHGFRLILPANHRCSHMRSVESNWSVFTGFARYSEAPASRQRSRSPFIAFAVSATIG